MVAIKLNPQLSSDVVLTIGNFDGLHQGHLQLFEKMNDIAKKNFFHRVCITFEPLTHEYFDLVNNVPVKSRLTLLRDKIDYIQQNDLADEVVVLRFNSLIANLSAEDFVLMLQSKYNIKQVVLGHDFRFGYKALGDLNTFANLGIEVTEIDQFSVDENRVSSTQIRQLYAINEISQANKLLGRNLRYTSRVIRGNQIGRKYGVPTINLNLAYRKPALWGIYYAYVYIDNERFNAVASVGTNPTVSQSKSYKLEAHLLDVDLNLYGKIATIEFLEFMRPELKFNNMDELFRQIELDLLLTRDFFKRK